MIKPDYHIITHLSLVSSRFRFFSAFERRRKGIEKECDNIELPETMLIEFALSNITGTRIWQREGCPRNGKAELNVLHKGA